MNDTSLDDLSGNSTYYEASYTTATPLIPSFVVDEMAAMEIEPIYTEAQRKALALIPYFPAALSLAGSCTILYIVLSPNSRDKLRKSSYTRLMLGISSMDAVCSLGLIVFGSWAVPAEASALAWGASGTTQTCEAVAFFLTCMIGNMIYTSFLSVYFCLRVKFQISEQFLAKYCEPFFHAIPIFYVLATTITGLITGDFNPNDQNSGWCWLADYPPNCSQDPDVECMRGENYIALATLAGGMVVLLCTATILLCMLLIVAQVMALEWRLRRYGHGSGSNAKWKRTKEVGTQALLYIGSFILTTFWIPLGQLMRIPETPEHMHMIFALSFVVKLMTPMQGFFNCLIFWRRRRSEMGNSSNMQSSSATTSNVTFPSFRRPKLPLFRRRSSRRESNTDEATPNNVRRHSHSPLQTTTPTSTLERSHSQPIRPSATIATRRSSATKSFAFEEEEEQLARRTSLLSFTEEDDDEEEESESVVEAAGHVV